MYSVFSWISIFLFCSGLLGAHSMAIALKKNGNMQWYEGELLNKTTEIADKLLLAFNTSTGIPYPKVSFLYTE